MGLREKLKKQKALVKELQDQVRYSVRGGEGKGW